MRFLQATRNKADAVTRKTAESRMIRDETHRQVREAVAGLPPRYREVVVLRYLEELPIAEVAEALGVKRGTVEVRLHRARGRLKGKLADLL